MKKFFVVLTVISLFQISTIDANANAKQVLKQVGGVTTGIIVSPMVGGFRGAVKGVHLGTDHVAAGLGNKDSSFARGFGALTGGIVGGAACGFAGLIKGGYEGVHYGVHKPFSKENYSLTGNGITHYNVLD